MRVIDFLQNGAAVGRKAPSGLLQVEASAMDAKDSRGSDSGSDEEGNGPAPPATAAGALSLMAVTWQQRLAYSWPKVRGLTQSKSKLVGVFCGRSSDFCVLRLFFCCLLGIIPLDHLCPCPIAFPSGHLPGAPGAHGDALRTHRPPGRHSGSGIKPDFLLRCDTL